MKQFLFAVGLLMTLTFSRLQAQTMDLRATIPFEFRAGQVLMPAGDYRINHSDGKLILRPQSGGKPLIMLTFSTDLPTESDTPGLLFHRYGDTCFFAVVWTPGYAAARGIQQSRMEREVARRGNPDENSNIILQTK